MANNRIFLKCRVCGKQFMLAKSFGTGFFAENYHGKTFRQNFNEFLDEHTFCLNDGSGDSDEGDFVLEYETTPFNQFIEDKRKHFISVSTDDIDRAMKDGKTEELMREAYEKAARYIAAHGGVPEAKNG